MSLLKDERTVRLDDVNREAAEAATVFEDLLGHVENARLETLVRAHIPEHARLVEIIVELRRARGELPQAADPERSHLGAAGEMLKAAVLPGDARAHYAESLIEAATRVVKQVEHAQELKIEPALATALHELKQANERFAANVEQMRD